MKTDKSPAKQWAEDRARQNLELQWARRRVNRALRILLVAQAHLDSLVPLCKK